MGLECWSAVIIGDGMHDYWVDWTITPELNASLMRFRTFTHNCVITWTIIAQCSGTITNGPVPLFHFFGRIQKMQGQIEQARRGHRILRVAAFGDVSANRIVGAVIVGGRHFGEFLHVERPADEFLGVCSSNDTAGSRLGRVGGAHRTAGSDVLHDQVSHILSVSPRPRIDDAASSKAADVLDLLAFEKVRLGTYRLSD